MSQSTGTIRRDIAALATADIQRMREADSFFDRHAELADEGRDVVAGAEALHRVEQLLELLDVVGVPQLGIIFPQSASSVRPQNWYGV